MRARPHATISSSYFPHWLSIGLSLSISISRSHSRALFCALSLLLALSFSRSHCSLLFFSLLSLTHTCSSEFTHAMSTSRPKTLINSSSLSSTHPHGVNFRMVNFTPSNLPLSLSLPNVCACARARAHTHTHIHTHAHKHTSILCMYNDMHKPFINRHPSNSKEQKRRVDHRSRDSSREKTQSSNVASCELSTGAEFAAHESRSMRSRCVCDWICVCVCDATIYVCACVSCLLVTKNKVESCIYLYTHHPCRHHSLTHISFMGYTRACARACATRVCVRVHVRVFARPILHQFHSHTP